MAEVDPHGPPLLDIIGVLDATEGGHDTALIDARRPKSIPVTDAKHDGVRRGGPLRRLAEKANARRDSQVIESRRAHLRGLSVSPMSSPLSWPAEQTMKVQPAPGNTVLDINGNPYPPGVPTTVPVNDVYAHRRLRDGSLVRVP